MIALNRDPLYTAPSDADVNGPEFDCEISEHTRLIATAYLIRGRRFLEIGRFNEAIADLTTAIKLDPMEAEAYEHRARAHHELGDVPNRERDLRRAHELRQQSEDCEPGRWLFIAGYELVARRHDGSERTVKTYPLTNQDRDDALLDAALVFSRQEWRSSPAVRDRSEPIVYEQFPKCRELREGVAG